MTGLDALLPPATSPQERQSTQLAAMRRQINELQRAQRQTYVEDLDEVNPGTSGTSAILETPDIFIEQPQFIEYVGVLEGRTSNSATAFPSWTANVEGTSALNANSISGRVFAVANSTLNVWNKAWTSPGQDSVNGFSPQGGGAWTVFWVPEPAVIRVRLTVAGSTVVAYRNRRLWVRY